ncbi:retrotransposon protein, putative, ty1-copia subclass [Tanacetum coccineum]
MVRSMMSQTTLPKSFWDYALESAAHILNMILTKKVKKTSYEDTQRKRWVTPSTMKNPVWEHELGDHNEPTNYKAALSYLESEKWLEALNGEMQSMKDNKVSKGFTQTYEVDYEEIFSPVADIRTIRILIAIVAYYDYEIWQMDVKTVFINGHLTEEVYMVQHKGFVNPKYPTKFNIENSKRGLIPMQEKPKLSKLKVLLQRMQRVPYASAVGSIIDIKRELRVTCYTDVGYLTDANDSKSQTGYVFVLNRGAVDWKIAKKSIIETSSKEAKYMAASEASKKAL